MIEMKVSDYELANIIAAGYYPRNWEYLGNGMFKLLVSEDRVKDYQDAIKNREFDWLGLADALQITNFIDMLKKGKD